MLYELIYSSRSTPAITSKTLENILDISTLKNLENNITGLLIFDGSTFCQILEGEKDVLEATYERIKNDSRHIDAEIFHIGEIEDRNFAQWSMSFKRIQQKIEPTNWTDWIAAQEQIANISAKGTLGGLIFKLFNGSTILEPTNQFGVN